MARMARMAELQNGNRMAETVEWQNGGMAEWQEWRYGRKNGRIAEWQKWLHMYYLWYTPTITPTLTTTTMTTPFNQLLLANRFGILDTSS